jgi:TPP-dependent pyruvate/acetoin dehydrogenase alpha subunit
VARARSGGGPTLLECRTYRFYGHAEGSYGLHPGDHDQRYRSTQEVAQYLERDPLALFRAAVTRDGRLDEATLSALDEAAEVAIDEAFASAFAAPAPAADALTTHVYAERVP